MADAEDLKSSGPKGRAGSSPALGIIELGLAVKSRFTHRKPFESFFVCDILHFNHNRRWA
jgi:hypothetical protein